MAPDHEAGDILQKNDRQPCLVAIHDETRRFIGAIGINDTAHLDALLFRAGLETLICDDAYGSPVDARIRSHNCLAVIRFVFID